MRVSTEASLREVAFHREDEARFQRIIQVGLDGAQAGGVAHMPATIAPEAEERAKDVLRRAAKDR